MRTAHNKNNIPWVEKYRPTHFDNIVLDPTNRQLFDNILERNYFPNLLLYGPPGTGKTTTIINLINAYQNKYSPSILSSSSSSSSSIENKENKEKQEKQEKQESNSKKNDSPFTNLLNKGTIIHLNASDERGIEIIRNQIYQFVRSKNLFETGLKFVILDEVDYMTKNAQQALKYLLQSSSYNVRFCLICNYISKIDDSLKNEFICIRFNQLPKEEIYEFVHKIAEEENLPLSREVIYTIQELYKSDIRSIINYIQLHQNIVDWENYVITEKVWNGILERLRVGGGGGMDVKGYIHSISIQYNMDVKNVIKNFLHYLIQRKPEYIVPAFLRKAEIIIHSSDMVEIPTLLDYLVEVVGLNPS